MKSNLNHELIKTIYLRFKFKSSHPKPLNHQFKINLNCNHPYLQPTFPFRLSKNKTPNPTCRLFHLESPKIKIIIKILTLTLTLTLTLIGFQPSWSLTLLVAFPPSSLSLPPYSFISYNPFSLLKV